jgi:hypothetical protein
MKLKSDILNGILFIIPWTGKSGKKAILTTIPWNVLTGKDPLQP